MPGLAMLFLKMVDWGVFVGSITRTSHPPIFTLRVGGIHEHAISGWVESQNCRGIIWRIPMLAAKDMDKHILFLLKPGFSDGEEGLLFCPHSAALEGLLTYVPEIESKVDVRRIDFPKPRRGIIDLLGEDNQFTPVLIVGENEKSDPQAQVSAATGRSFFLGEIEISKFLNRDLWIIKPH